MSINTILAVFPFYLGTIVSVFILMEIAGAGVMWLFKRLEKIAYNR